MNGECLASFQLTFSITKGLLRAYRCSLCLCRDVSASNICWLECAFVLSAHFAVRLNKYIRCRAMKNTFVFLPGEPELFKRKLEREKWLTWPERKKGGREKDEGKAGTRWARVAWSQGELVLRRRVKKKKSVIKASEGLWRKMRGGNQTEGKEDEERMPQLLFKTEGVQEDVTRSDKRQKEGRVQQAGVLQKTYDCTLVPNLDTHTHFYHPAPSYTHHTDLRTPPADFCRLT